MFTAIARPTSSPTNTPAETRTWEAFLLRRWTVSVVGIAAAFVRDFVRRFMMVLPQEFKSVCHRPCAGCTSSALLGSPAARLRLGYKTAATYPGGLCQGFPKSFQMAAMLRQAECAGTQISEKRPAKAARGGEEFRKTRYGFTIASASTRRSPSVRRRFQARSAGLLDSFAFSIPSTAFFSHFAASSRWLSCWWVMAKNRWQ